ncbi:UDP-N-acetylmuramoyl-tripeptide--D-alanyl-D-alanine ligase [Mollicutes bacterium LVI A0039]|nr:UDP-N-acetylmuramoyl-tripeptide--D-alanyl-D-alanine ligase [Mollicutes bacterium LVI A0039]
MEQLFTYIVLSSMLGVFLIAYFVMRVQKELQNIQQSAYTNSRYRSHIRENALRYFALNEVILLPTILLYQNHKFIMILIMFIFTYYNMRFFTISETRFDTKLKLNITARVKRQIVTLTVLIALSSIGLVYLGLPILHCIILITYLMPVYIMIVITINNPIEASIRNKFKRMATTKLKAQSGLFVIGITGSYGKTSIKNIIGDVVSEFEPELRTPASFNTPNGLSITINNYLKVLHKVFIAEMGAYLPGEIKELAVMTNPDIAIVSSIGPQHLETFKTIERVQSTKMELVEHVKPKGIAILNYDNQYIRDYQIKRDDVTVYSYGMDSTEYDMYGKDIEYGFGKMSFTVVDNINNCEYVVTTKLLGKHNLYNIMAAILVCIVRGYDMDKVIGAIAKVKPIEHRLEFKKINNETLIIDDAFNANVEGVKEAVNILSKYEDYTRILITPGVIDLGAKGFELNQEVAKTFEGKLDVMYMVGSYNEPSYSSIISTSATIDYHKVDNFLEAYAQANAITGKKIILICNDLPDKFN